MISFLIRGMLCKNQNSLLLLFHSSFGNLVIGRCTTVISKTNILAICRQGVDMKEIKPPLCIISYNCIIATKIPGVYSKFFLNEYLQSPWYDNSSNRKLRQSVKATHWCSMELLLVIIWLWRVYYCIVGSHRTCSFNIK